MHTITKATRTRISIDKGYSLCYQTCSLGTPQETSCQVTQLQRRCKNPNFVSGEVRLEDCLERPVLQLLAK